MSNCKLVVEVLSAKDLFPLQREGSSLYVQLLFDGQRMCTTAKLQAITMTWNERFCFNVLDPSQVGELYLKTHVYNFNKNRKSQEILGQIRVPGRSFASSTDADVIYYALEKSSVFSHASGHLGLKVFLLQDDNIPIGAAEGIPSSNSILDGFSPSQADQVVSIQHSAPMEQSCSVLEDQVVSIQNSALTEQRQADKLVSIQNSAPTKQSCPSQANPLVNIRNSAPLEQSCPSPVVQEVNINDLAPLEQSVNFALTESAHLANGRVLDCGFERKLMPPETALVQTVRNIFIRVVKARDLPDMASGGGIDPFVEVRVGVHKNRTNHLEKTYNPEWNCTYAFSIDQVKEADFVEVIVKHKDQVKDDFVGMVRLHTHDVQKRTSNGPLYPVWHPLTYESREKAQGAIMLAVWMSDQADDAFADAMCLDSINASGSFDISCIRSKVYDAPTLWYMRVSIIEAYGITQAGMSLGNLYVKAQVDHQCVQTKTAQAVDLHPTWNEDLMFVVAEPLEGELILKVEGNNVMGPNVIIGKAVVPIASIAKRNDDKKVDSRTCPIDVMAPTLEANMQNVRKSEGHLVIRVCLEGGYHVLDEPIELSSDLRPTAKELWKDPIGRLELGILKVEGIPNMSTTLDGHETINAYCVAKYGKRWARTRTVMNNSDPIFNEEHSWDVYDPSTVLTVGVFYNCQIGDGEAPSGRNKDVRIGQIYIQVSTLLGRVVTQKHPLQLLFPSGIKKMGEIHLSIRFSRTAIRGHFLLYLQPMLPEMHQKLALRETQINDLRQRAVEIVATRLSQMDTPLRKEVILCMYSAVPNSWSGRKSTAYYNCIMSVARLLNKYLSSFEDVRSWKKFWSSLAWLGYCFCSTAFLLSAERLFEFIIFLSYLGLFFMLLANSSSSRNFDTRICPAELRPMLGEQFDQFDATVFVEHTGNGQGMLTDFACWAQTLLGNVAIFLDKIEALLTWRDYWATCILFVLNGVCIIVLLLYQVEECARPSVLKYVLFEYCNKYIVCAVAWCLMLGPPWVQHPVVGGSTRIFMNFFRRLPVKTAFLI